MDYTKNFTPVPNEILQKAAQARLNGTQYAIMLTVWRYTYGFQRGEHELSLTFIARATGIHRLQIQREIKKLIDFKILKVVREAAFNHQSRIIALNENLEDWELNSKQLTKTLTGNKNINHTVNGLANRTVNGLVNQEIKLKENIKEIDGPPVKGNSFSPFTSKKQKEMFNTFWLAYPKKKSKGQAEKTWAKINPDNGLFDEIMQGLERAKKSKDWKKDGGQFMQHPSTWLNAKGWEDEHDRGPDDPNPAIEIKVPY